MDIRERLKRAARDVLPFEDGAHKRLHAMSLAEIERLRAALWEIACHENYPPAARIAREALAVNEQTTPKYGCGHPQIADQDGTLPECPFCAAQNR